LETAEGDLVGGADLRQLLKLLLREVTDGKNHLCDWIFLKDVFQGIERSEDGIPIHLFSLVSKVIVDETDRTQPQDWIMYEFSQGVGPGLTHPIDQDVSTPVMISRGVQILKNSEGTPCSDHQKEEKIEIDNQCSPANDPKAWNEPEKKP